MTNFVSERQLQVWRLAALGYSKKQITARLGICRGTVDKHKAILFERLGVRGIVGLTLKAVEHGVVTLPPTRPLVQGKIKQRVRWGIPE